MAGVSDNVSYNPDSPLYMNDDFFAANYIPDAPTPDNELPGSPASPGVSGWANQFEPTSPTAGDTGGDGSGDETGDDGNVSPPIPLSQWDKKSTILPLLDAEIRAMPQRERYAYYQDLRAIQSSYSDRKLSLPDDLQASFTFVVGLVM